MTKHFNKNGLSVVLFEQQVTKMHRRRVAGLAWQSRIHRDRVDQNKNEMKKSKISSLAKKTKENKTTAKQAAVEFVDVKALGSR